MPRLIQATPLLVVHSACAIVPRSTSASQSTNEQRANRATARDKYLFAQHTTSTLNGVQAHRQGFCQCRFRQAQVLSDRVCLVSFNDELLCEGALDVREGHGAAKEAHVQTMILLSRLAEAARAAGARRRNGNALTHCEVFDVCPKRADDA